MDLDETVAQSPSHPVHASSYSFGGAPNQTAIDASMSTPLLSGTVNEVGQRHPDVRPSQDNHDAMELQSLASDGNEGTRWSSGSYSGVHAAESTSRGSSGGHNRMSHNLEPTEALPLPGIEQRP